MPICQVKSAAVEEEINGKTGEVIRGQTVGLDLGNGHQLPFRIGLGKKPPLQPGNYDIDPKSFGLNEYGGLTLKKYVDLVPLPDHKPASSAKA